MRAGGSPVATPSGDSVESLLARFAHGRAVSGTTTLDELGLSSLERVELMVALEDRFQTRVDEGRFSEVASVADLKRLVEAPAAGAEGVEEPVEFPSWNRTWPVRLVRRLSQATWIVPLTRAFAYARVEGLEHLRHIERPRGVRLESPESHGRAGDHLGAARPLAGACRSRDGQGILQGALLPPPTTHGGSGSPTPLNYYLAAFFFNAFPLPQREAGARQTLKYIGELTGMGWSILIFPEGMRSPTGQLKPFRGGIGMIGSRLDIPIVPIRIDDVDKLMPMGSTFVKPGRVRVTFGAPLRLRGDDYAALAAQVEEAVRSL